MGSPEFNSAGQLQNRNYLSSKVDYEGFEAEFAVEDFFNAHYPKMATRRSTAKEDAGITQQKMGKAIDLIVYSKEDSGRPMLGLQVTTALDSKVRLKKMDELKQHPFLRLDEMKATDASIPRVLIFVDASEVSRYTEDKDFKLHEKLSSQILESIINSLKFDLLQTKNPKEQTELKRQILMWESEAKMFISGNNYKVN